MSEWQPIETAPDDGTEVMCAWKAIGRWIMEPCVLTRGIWTVGWDGTEVTPTLWTSMPEVPK